MAVIPDIVLRALAALLAVVAGVGFAFMFGDAISDVWAATDGQPPRQTESYLYVATTVAALVGGIVAVGFGVPGPANGDGGGRNALLATNVTGVGSLVLAGLGPAAVIGSLYAIVYILWGLAALVTWMMMPDQTSDLVKNLATTFLGLALPIVSGFFRR